MNKVKVQLVKYLSDTENSNQVFIYNVEHNNGVTSVDQNMTLSSNDLGMQPTWNASICLDKFPDQKTPEDAALKLADWLERLSIGIRNGDYLPPVRSKYKDVEDVHERDTTLALSTPKS